jgi:hypothetical protein
MSKSVCHALRSTVNMILVSAYYFHLTNLMKQHGKHIKLATNISKTRNSFARTILIYNIRIIHKETIINIIY